MQRRIFQAGKLHTTCVLNLFLGGLTLIAASATHAQDDAAPPPAAAAEEAAAPDIIAIDAAACNICSTDPCCDWCNLGDKWLLADHLFNDPCNDAPFTVGGFTQFGYHSESNGLFNSHDSKLQNHQSWIYAEKVADGSCGLGFGFRVDFMYGLDAQDTQAFGEPAPQDHFDNPWDHGIYGFAMPQAYIELASGDWSVKAGHFYTMVGYEVVPATGNFFYSHAYTMFNSEPFTHTGVISTYQLSCNVEVYGGWVAGWDTGFDRFADGDQSRGSAFMGGAALTLTDDATLTYITTIGDLGTRGEGYSHSLVLDVDLDCDWNYVLQSDLVETNGGGDHQFGVNQYLFYSINDCLKVGSRMEWWKNGSNSQYAATFGINYLPSANLIIRPEVRHDWNPSGIRFNGDGKGDFTTFGIDAILSF
jgi:hypothetical protein